MATFSKRLGLLILIICFWEQSNAQKLASADEVFNNYLNTIGGKNVISRINDIQIETSLSLLSATDDGEGKTRHIYKLPTKSLVVFYDKNEEISRQASDGVCLTVNSFHKLFSDRIYQGPLARGYILSSALFPELYYKALGLNVTFNGIEKIDLTGVDNSQGKDAYKITFSTQDGSIFWSAYYDVDTFLKVQLSGPRHVLDYGIESGQRGADHIYYLKYLNYQDFNGLKFPTIIKEYTRTTLVRKVEINKNPDDSIFKVD